MTQALPKKTTKVNTSAYDVAEHLRTPEEMAAYLDAWFEGVPDDVSGIARALGDIARAKGMSQVAKDAGLRACEIFRNRLGVEAPMSVFSPMFCSEGHEMRCYPPWHGAAGSRKAALRTVAPA